MNPEKKSLTIQMNEDIYAMAVRCFEEYGASLPASFERSPHMAYAVFDVCVRQIHRAHLGTPSITHIVSGHDIQEAEQILELEKQIELGGRLPPLEDDTQEIVIQVIRNPSLWQSIRRKNKKPKIKTVLHFNIPIEDK